MAKQKQKLIRPFYRCFRSIDMWRWWCSYDPNDVFAEVTKAEAVELYRAAKLLGFNVYGDEDLRDAESDISEYSNFQYILGSKDR